MSELPVENVYNAVQFGAILAEAISIGIKLVPFSFKDKNNEAF